MRIIIKLSSEKPIVLPLQYNHIVQGMLLNLISEKNYSSFIHNSGYQYKGRSYKMYTFSRLEGRYTINRENKTITYKEGVSLTVSSMDNKFLSYIVNSLLKNNKVKLGKNIVTIVDIQCFDKDIEGDLIVYTKSPIVIYSTFINNDRKKTYYYNPYEREFKDLIRENLIKKYRAIFENEPFDNRFTIEPLNKHRLRENILIYKNTVIKGWQGEFNIKGSRELLKIAYNSGIGSKNSQGFGCIEIKNNY